MKSRKGISLLLLIGCSALILGLSAGSAAGQQAQPLVFRSQVVFDEQFMGMEVFRMLVPKDWKFEGGITLEFL
ncbi:MAG: DUF4148 domain-containing protein [Candidatus Saccharicenans sp.]